MRSDFMTTMITRTMLALACSVCLLTMACGATGQDVVDACKRSIDAENDLPCVEPEAFKNSERECGDLDTQAGIVSSSTLPGAVRACAGDGTCSNDDLILYFECREESAFCDDQGQATAALSCDDHLQ